MWSSERVCILVKAYPQPSEKYEETVCCAGITPDGRMVRVYPIPYRSLLPEQRFGRFDVIEAKMIKAPNDFRPESFRVEPTSIRVVQRGDSMTPEQKAALWLPHVAESIAALKEQNRTSERSLGIVRPKPETVRFKWSAIDADDVAINESLSHQAAMFATEVLKPLKADYAFSYQFRTGDNDHDMKIHDWEVQAAHQHYKHRYREAALEQMRVEYGVNMPNSNLHLILGTMQKHPRQFIIIGLLRTSAALDAIAAQSTLGF